MSKSILFLVPYPTEQAPSQRFRFEQYLDVLEKNKFSYTIRPFLSEQVWTMLYTNKNKLSIVISLWYAIAKRKLILFSVYKYDFIFIHREAAPFGPPIFEWIMAKILRKKVIYDFDDAIWLEDPDEKGSFRSKIKWKSKVSKICKWSYRISAGNEYLASFARQFSNHVIINPTTIDTENWHNPKLYEEKQNNKPVIGWTGTHSTLQYLNALVPVIQELEQEYDFSFLVIANHPPQFKLKSLVYQKWSKSSEISDLLKIDIGVMPLTDDEWSKGKCGFKALQYMALKIPALVSPVGVNKDIVDHGVNGYICSSLDEWKVYLKQLLEREAKRKELGVAARKKIESNYSVSSNAENFLSLFE